MLNVFSRYRAKKSVEIVLAWIFSVVVGGFRVCNRWRGRAAILVYTDSRGADVTTIWGKRNPFTSYIGRLVTQYSCDVVICPEKYTSLLDFLYYFESRGKTYDAIVLQCGIVDFAPRPESSFDDMYRSKIKLIRRYGLEKYIQKQAAKAGPEYMGEKTYQFLTAGSLTDVILPRLRHIDGLIYIGINRVVDGWNGRYWRSRPDNINDQLELDKIVRAHIANVIDFEGLSDDEIKALTIDNVHYTADGFSWIDNMLCRYLPSSLC